MSSPSSRLIVLGAGPVGAHLARLAVDVDFRVMVIDEREDVLSAAQLPSCVERLQGDFSTLLPALPTSTNDYIAIVAQVWERDAVALRLLVNRDLAYLGMIGGQRKVAEIFASLQAAGISPATIARIKAPIGLNIGSKTPAEIAVSIAAELISVRRERAQANSV